MTGLSIQNNVYEQDIREFLMSSYSGELYTRELKDDLEFYVETALGDGTISVIIWEKDGEREAGSDSSGDTTWKPVMSRTGTSGLSDHPATKDVVKKMFYQMLVERTKKELLWGSLTGIRSIKITLTRLEEGWREQGIRFFMKETYVASDGKIDLSIGITAREKKSLEPFDYDWGYGLYAEIPLYPTTCLYCSFTSLPISKWTGHTGLYLGALLKELEHTAKKMQDRPLDTTHFGGGTPAAPPAEGIDVVLCKLEQLFNKKHVLGFAVEARCLDSITEEELKVLRDHDITRISIDPQTMNQKTLEPIGRRHPVEMTKERFIMVRELRSDNTNVDLAMGLPEEGLDDVRYTLEKVRKLVPDSLTVHPLAIKRAVRLHVLREQYEGLETGDAPEMVDLNAVCVRETGMEPYYLYRQGDTAGNSGNMGYSLPGKAYMYSILIMEEVQTVVAYGAGTITKVVFPSENRRERCKNVKEMGQYISRIDEMIRWKERTLDPFTPRQSGIDEKFRLCGPALREIHGWI